MRDEVMRVVTMLVMGMVMGVTVLMMALSPETVEVWKIRWLLLFADTLTPEETAELLATAKFNGAPQSVLLEIEDRGRDYFRLMEDRAQRRVML